MAFFNLQPSYFPSVDGGAGGGVCCDVDGCEAVSANLP